LILFIIAALPVLIWKMGGDPIDLSLRPSWVDFLNLTMFQHIFAMIGPYPGTWAIFLNGLSTLALFFIAAAWIRQQQVDRTFLRPVTTAYDFIYAGIIVLLINVIVVNWFPVTILIQSQIARIGLYILIIAYLFFANLLASLVASDKKPDAKVWLLLISFLFSPFPILPLIIWLFVRFVKKPVFMKMASIVTLVCILILIFVFAQIGFWNPGIFIYGQTNPWVDVQRWARKNTQVDARFITPPGRWGVNESDWRVYSERASAVTLSELLVAAFQPGYEEGWKSRFELVAPGALSRFNGDYFRNAEITRRAYNSLSPEDLFSAACSLDSQYIVSEKPSSFPFPLVYENSGFTVYDVSGLACD